MEGEQFSLCWNNFHSNLSSGFHSLLREEDLVDVTLAAEGKFLKAHKTVLSVCSPFFKELFRVNPCKHPIVILPDVNYGALCSLLHFMYQGEVSVSQEEIPTFMRVAETLKVKGLTDNNTSPSDTNGYPNPPRNTYAFPDQRNIMKRPRPVKKILKPTQHLRPIEGQPVKSPQPAPIQTVSQQPPAKKIHLEEPVPSPSTTPKLDLQVKPKQEPVDISHEEENTRHSDDTMDLSHVLDATVGEPSSSPSFPTWPPLEIGKPVSLDSSTPGGPAGLMLLKSGRGQLVLIHNGHIYTLSDKKDARSLWVCVKKKTLNCEGCVTTVHGPILFSYSGHNHPQMHEVIQRLQVPSCSISPELM